MPNYTAAEYHLLLTDFRRRLDELVSYAEQVGALPVLILPPANDAGFEPNRSFLPPMTPRSERDAFARDLPAVRQLETVNPAAAMRPFSRADRSPALFRGNTLPVSPGSSNNPAQWDEAYREYVAARDLDGMPMRCLSPFQDAYREVAARHGCILIDGQSYFHAIGRHGLLDDELFQDAMHPSLRGQIALAQAILVALRARQAFGWPKIRGCPARRPGRMCRAFWHRQECVATDCLVVEGLQRADVSA